MKNIKLIIVLLALSSSSVFGQQDVHFSQFFSSPLTLNPANAGIFDGDLRAIVNYRNQWSSISKSYATSAASLDFPILREMGGGMFGLGVNFSKDGSGDSKLSTTNFALSVAYHLDISGGQNNHYLSLGFQAGAIQRSINHSNLTWDNQWNGSGFDRQVQSTSVGDLGGTSAKAMDLSTGMHWYYAPTNETRVFAGFSFFHFNRPDIGFGIETHLLRKLTVHGGGEINIGEGLAFMPNFVTAIQGSNKYTDVGAEFKYFIKENSKFTNYSNEMFFSAGPYLRWNDAAYIVARLGLKSFVTSISYDFNISKLANATSGAGGFEIMLGYKLNLSKTATKGHKLRFK